MWSEPVCRFWAVEVDRLHSVFCIASDWIHPVGGCHVWYFELILEHMFFSLVMHLEQRFSIPVLTPPCSAYFVCHSYRFRCLFYLNVSALRSGHHTIFLHDSSLKRMYIFHSKCIEVCKTWIKIVYIYRGIWCHTRPCVKTLRNANPWMNVPKWSKLQRISLLRE